jgi:L-methionine (R)-S-oxide reductase
MDERLANEVADIVAAPGRLEAKAAELAGVIRVAGGYRWVGIYEVTESEIGVLGWSGPSAPAHPRFPLTEGLSGAAVASRETVVVGDVREDPRYLTTYGSTRSEVVVPIMRSDDRVVGTLDVESAELDTFPAEECAAIERIAEALAPLWDDQ